VTDALTRRRELAASFAEPYIAHPAVAAVLLAVRSPVGVRRNLQSQILFELQRAQMPDIFYRKDAKRAKTFFAMKTTKGTKPGRFCLRPRGSANVISAICKRCPAQSAMPNLQS
jgi:hypothetical protein